MIIKKVDNIIDAIECNKLLNKLIENESKYDKNIKSNYIINEYFEKIHNNKNNCLFMAKDNDNLAIGYIFWKIITNDNGPYKNHIALIDGLYVNEEYRHKGIATNLINECKKWAKETGATIIELNVMSENINAINLYQNIGFKELEKKMRLNL